MTQVIILPHAELCPEGAVMEVAPGAAPAITINVSAPAQGGPITNTATAAKIVS